MGGDHTSSEPKGRDSERSDRLLNEKNRKRGEKRKKICVNTEVGGRWS